MSPLELTGAQILYFSFAASIILLIAFVFRPAAFLAAAFCACLVTTALMYVVHARPQIARPPMSEEAAIYRRQLDALSIEKEKLENRAIDAERKLSKALTDQIRFADTLVAFEESYPSSFIDTSPLHMRVKKAASDAQVLTAQLKGTEQRLLEVRGQLLEMTSANKMLQRNIDSLKELNREAQAALSELRRQNERLSARIRFVGSRLGARIVRQRKLEADLQAANLKSKSQLTSPETLCEALTNVELADVATDHRRLPERFGVLQGYKITLRKSDTTQISLRGIPPDFQQPDQHLDSALEAVAKKLQAAARGCSPQAVLVKSSANLQPITSKRPSSEYHYARAFQRYTEDPSTGALVETAPLALEQINITNPDLPDVRSAYVAEKLRRRPPLLDVHVGIISGEVAADSTRQPEILIFVPRHPVF